MNTNNVELIRVPGKVDFNIVFLTNLLNDNNFYLKKTLYVDLTQFNLWENIILKHVAINAKYKVVCTSTLDFEYHKSLIAKLAESKNLSGDIDYSQFDDSNIDSYIISLTLYLKKNVIILTSQNRFLLDKNDSRYNNSFIEYWIHTIDYDFENPATDEDYNLHVKLNYNLMNTTCASCTGSFLFLDKEFKNQAIKDWELMDYVLSTGKLPIEIEKVHSFMKFKTVDYTKYKYNDNIYHQKLYKSQVTIVKLIEDIVKYELPKNRLSKKY